jgi:hypothetical protein
MTRRSFFRFFFGFAVAPVAAAEPVRRIVIQLPKTGWVSADVAAMIDALNAHVGAGRDAKNDTRLRRALSKTT